VEKDLAAITMAIFDTWDKNKDQLNHKILYCADARVSPDDIISVIEKGTDTVSILRLAAGKCIRAERSAN
jgi:hypothetical protein